MWRKLIKGERLYLVGCLGTEPRWLCRKNEFVRRLGEAAALGEGSAGRAPA